MYKSRTIQDHDDEMTFFGLSLLLTMSEKVFVAFAWMEIVVAQHAITDTLASTKYENEERRSRKKAQQEAMMALATTDGYPKNGKAKKDPMSCGW